MIPAQIISLIPLLGTTFDGELVAARDAMTRKLKAVGLDWHDVAHALENASIDVAARAESGTAYLRLLGCRVCNCVRRHVARLPRPRPRAPVAARARLRRRDVRHGIRLPSFAETGRMDGQHLQPIEWAGRSMTCALDFSTPQQAVAAMVAAGAVFAIRRRGDALSMSFTYRVAAAGDANRCRAILVDVKSRPPVFLQAFRAAVQDAVGAAAERGAA